MLDTYGFKNLEIPLIASVTVLIINCQMFLRNFFFNIGYYKLLLKIKLLHFSAHTTICIYYVYSTGN